MNAQEHAELRETLHRVRYERDEAIERVAALRDAIIETLADLDLDPISNALANDTARAKA